MPTSRRKPIGAAVIAAIMLIGLSRNVISQQPATPPVSLPQAAIQQIAALQAEKARRTPAERKISSRLLRAGRMRRGEPVAPGIAATRQTIAPDVDGRVEVDLRSE